MDAKKKIDRMYKTFSRTCFSIFWKRYKSSVMLLYLLMFVLCSVVGFFAIKAWNEILVTLFAILIIFGYDVEKILFLCLYISDSVVFICVMMVVLPIIVSIKLSSYIIKKFFLKSSLFGDNNPGYRIALRHLQLQLRTVVNYKDPVQLALIFDQLRHSKKTTRHLNEILNEFQKAKM